MTLLRREDPSRFSLFFNLGKWQIPVIALKNFLRVLKSYLLLFLKLQNGDIYRSRIIPLFLLQPIILCDHFFISFGFHDTTHSQFSFSSLVTIPHLPILVPLNVRVSQCSIYLFSMFNLYLGDPYL